MDATTNTNFEETTTSSEYQTEYSAGTVLSQLISEYDASDGDVVKFMLSGFSWDSQDNKDDGAEPVDTIVQAATFTIYASPDLIINRLLTTSEHTNEYGDTYEETNTDFSVTQGKIFGFEINGQVVSNFLEDFIPYMNSITSTSFGNGQVFGFSGPLDGNVWRSHAFYLSGALANNLGVPTVEDFQAALSQPGDENVPLPTGTFSLDQFEHVVTSQNVDEAIFANGQYLITENVDVDGSTDSTDSSTDSSGGSTDGSDGITDKPADLDDGVFFELSDYQPSDGNIKKYTLQGISILETYDATGAVIYPDEGAQEATLIIYASSDLVLSLNSESSEKINEDGSSAEDQNVSITVSQGKIFDVKLNGESVSSEDLKYLSPFLGTEGADNFGSGELLILGGKADDDSYLSHIFYLSGTLDETLGVPSKQTIETFMSNRDGGAPLEDGTFNLEQFEEVSVENVVINHEESTPTLQISIVDSVDAEVVEYTLSGFFFDERYSGDGATLSDAQEAKLVIQASEDLVLERVSKTFTRIENGKLIETTSTTIGVTQGEVYGIELNDKNLDADDLETLYSFMGVLNVVDFGTGEILVAGQDISSDSYRNNIFYLSGNLVDSLGVPTQDTLAKFKYEGDEPIRLEDGTFSLADFAHVLVSDVDPSETITPFEITSIADDGILTISKLENWKIDGTAEAGSEITITLGGQEASTIADTNGTWRLTGQELGLSSLSDLSAFKDGVYNFTVTGVAASGNKFGPLNESIEIDVEKEVAGYNISVSGTVSAEEVVTTNLESKIGSDIIAAAETLQTSTNDSDDDVEAIDAKPSVNTLLGSATELQDINLSETITTLVSGDQVALRATNEKTALSLDLGNDAGNLDKTVLLNEYETVVVTGSARIRGGEGSNTFLGDNASQDVMMGADDDYLNTGGGNDTVGSAGGNDTIYGGSGNDVAFGGTGNDHVNGGSGDDHILDSWGADMLSGGTGDDIIQNFEGRDTIHSGIGNDTVYGGRGDDSIDGGDGNDVLYGDTILFSSNGSDTLIGGAGNDTMQGGYGEDTFVFAFGDDGFNTIGRIDGGADFESGIDHVHLVGFAGINSSNVLDYINDVAGAATFEADGVLITFEGLVKADLDSSDFILV